jgi:hypothetical protein
MKLFMQIQDHFNTLQTLTPLLYMNADLFLRYYQEILAINLEKNDFFLKNLILLQKRKMGGFNLEKMEYQNERR